MSSQSNKHWLRLDVVLAIHERQIAEHGGILGVRDLALREAALARPHNLDVYAAAAIPDLAATYALGIVRNHPFLDGNKRVAFVLLETFLELNGWHLTATDEDSLRMTWSLAAGEMTDDVFATWVRKHAKEA